MDLQPPPPVLLCLPGGGPLPIRHDRHHHRPAAQAVMRPPPERKHHARHPHRTTPDQPPPITFPPPPTPCPGWARAASWRQGRAWHGLPARWTYGKPPTAVAANTGCSTCRPTALNWPCTTAATTPCAPALACRKNGAHATPP